MFNKMEKQFETDFGRQAKWEGLTLPETKLTNIITEPDHYRYDFSVKDIPSGRLLVNSFEDRGAAYLSLRVQDEKSEDKVYEYTTTPDGKVSEWKLLTGGEQKPALENAPQEPNKISTSKTDTTLSKDVNKQKSQVHVSSSGNIYNAMTYRLPSDVMELELAGIKAERKSAEGLLCVYIPRRQGMNTQSTIRGKNVTNIPIKDL